MASNIRVAFAAMCVSCLVVCHPARSESSNSATVDFRTPSNGPFASLPLLFEENRGQVDPTVRYLARGPGYQVFLTSREAVVVLANAAETSRPEAGRSTASLGHPSSGTASVVRMLFEDANPNSTVSGEEILPHKTNYLLGADPAQHVLNVPSHMKVKYKSVYPGVDVVYYGNAGRLEYDVLVAPGASTAPIKISFPTATKVSISTDGDLVLAMPSGDVRYHKPIAYQEVDGLRNSVDAEYLVADTGQVSFRLGDYDPTKPLVIDPLLSYSSSLWGGSLTGLVRDSAGNAYVVGYTGSSDVPASTGYLTKLTGSQDAYVAKFSPAGALIWATYLGARRAVTYGQAIAVDVSGNVYVGGQTNSASFPVTAGAYQTTWTGGSFITKLNPTGSALVYSTFIGTYLTSIAVDAGGNTYATGKGNGLVTTAGAFRTSPPSADSLFVAKLNAAGSAMAYATFLGGSNVGGQDQAYAVAVDSAGSAYITGVTLSSDFATANALQPTLHGNRDAFVTKLNAAGSALVYSTFLGGANYEYGYGIAVDGAGQAFVVGETHSADFPVTQGAFQQVSGYPAGGYSNGFIAKLDAAGSSLIYSSYLGGRCTDCVSGSASVGDGATAVSVDLAGYAYVGGYVTSLNFPQIDPIRAIADSSGFNRAVYVAKVRPDGSGLIYSTSISPRMADSAVRLNGLGVDSSGSVFAAGQKGFESLFPITPGAQLTSGATFIAKLDVGRFPTTVRSSANPVSASQPVTIVADVQSNVLGGTVTFYSGSTPLGTAPVSGGRASVSVNLGPGIYKLTAVYSADGKVSPPLFQLVNSQ